MAGDAAVVRRCPPAHALTSPAQAEEGPAVPSRAGDGAGDGGERAVGPPLELEAVGQHRDDVLDALVLPDQPGPGDRPVVGADPAQDDVAAVELLAQRLQPGDRLGLQPAIGQFLDPVGQPALQVGPAERRRLLAEQLPPLLLQVGEWTPVPELPSAEGRRPAGWPEPGLAIARCYRTRTARVYNMRLVYSLTGAPLMRHAAIQYRAASPHHISRDIWGSVALLHSR